MTRLRATVLVAVLWCGVVALGATLVWLVISRAGAGVVPLTQPQADLTGSLPVPTGAESSAGPARPSSPGVHVSPHPSRTATPSRSASTGSSLSSAPSSSSPPPPVPQRRSWSGSAGHLVAECSGPSVGLVTAFPNAGWRYAVLSRGPAQVGVRFTRVGGDDRSMTVGARCVSGVPRFSETPRTGEGDD
jgi:hypothetical protein